jgi:hypothetical protein
MPTEGGVSRDVAERGPPGAAQSMDEDASRKSTRQVRPTEERTALVELGLEHARSLSNRRQSVAYVA